MGNQILNKKKWNTPLLPSLLLSQPDTTTTHTTLRTLWSQEFHTNQLDSVTKSFQPTEKTTTTPTPSGKRTGLPTLKLTLTTKIAPLPNPTTGRVLNNAPNPGNAEVLECAKEEDGAPDMTVARELHSQNKHQVSPTINDRRWNEKRNFHGTLYI